VLDRVIAGPPRPLAMAAPGAPDELAAIVHKAMARDPAARYPNAIALAEDLRRFHTGQLVSAHSYSMWALVRKRLARYRGVAAVALASVIVLAAVGVASVRRVVAERNIARSQRGLAEEALASAEKRKRELVLLQAETALPKDPTAALAWLKTYDVGPGDRGKVVDMVDEALALGVARHVFRPGDWVIDAQFTPDGRSLVVAVRNGALYRYDLVTGVENRIGQAPSPPQALVLSPGGDLAVTGGAAGEVMVWPLHGGQPWKLVDAGGRAIWQLRLSADGRLILVERESSAPQVVALAGGEPAVLAPRSGLKFAVAADDWSHVVMMTAANEIAVPGTGDAVRVLGHTDKAIAFLAIAPRGDTVVVHDGTMVWAVPFAGGTLRPLARYTEQLKTIAWSSDGRTIAIGGTQPEVLVIDAATGAVTELRGHSDAIYTLAFSRDGGRLLSASDDATARVWNLASHTATVLRGHDDDVYRARFSADEHSVATSSLDGSTRVWSIGSSSAGVYVEHDPIEGMRFAGEHLVVHTSRAVARWDLASGARALLSSWDNESHNLGYGITSRDGDRVVIPGADGSLELRRRGQPPRVLRGHRGLITHVEFAHDGDVVFSASSDGTLRRWDVTTGDGAIVLDAGMPVRGFAVARDGRIAAQAGDLAYLIDPVGRVAKLGKGRAWCIELAEFEALTDRLIVHRCNNSLAIIDRDRVIELATGGYMASRLAMSPDHRWLAGGLVDRTIRIWNAETGEVIDVLRGHSDFVFDVAFSPDGGRLASASYDKTVRLWDLASKRHRVLRGHAASVTRVMWRDARQLVTGSSDGTIRLWDVPSLELPSEGELAQRLDAATTARIALDRPATTRIQSRGT